MEILTTEQSILPMAEVLTRARSRTWTLDPPDYLSHYLSKTERSTTTQVGNPSIATRSIDFLADAPAPAGAQAGTPTKATFELKLHPEMIQLSKEIPEWQVLHRSRALNLNPRYGIAQELLHRLERLKDTKEVLDEYQMPHRMSMEIEMAKADLLRKRMKWNRTWAESYMSDRTSRSVTGGIRWGEVLNAPDEQWQELCDLQIAQFEKIADGEMDGMYPADPFFLGSRARSLALDSMATVEGAKQTGEVYRARTILFMEMLSSEGVFLQKADKMDFLDRWLQLVVELCDPDYEPVFPLLVGGEIAPITDDLLHGRGPEHDVVIHQGDDVNTVRKGGELEARDGANWEGSVAGVRGSPAAYALAPIGGTFTLPSGVYDTSWSGTAAAVWVTSEWRRRGQPEQPLLEVAELDQKYKYILGMSYMNDGFPTLCGFKCVRDTPDAMRPVQLNRWNNMKRGPDPQALSVYTNAFKGLTPDGDSIMTWFAAAKAEDIDYFDPSKIIQEGLGTQTEI